MLTTATCVTEITYLLINNGNQLTKGTQVLSVHCGIIILHNLHPISYDDITKLKTSTRIFKSILFTTNKANV